MLRGVMLAACHAYIARFVSNVTTPRSGWRNCFTKSASLIAAEEAYPAFGVQIFEHHEHDTSIGVSRTSASLSPRGFVAYGS